MTIDNASPDAWYAPYAANSVTGRYVRVGEPRNPGSGPVQAFDIPADGDSEFVVVVAADDPALLVEFLDQIQGLDD